MSVVSVGVSGVSGVSQTKFSRQKYFSCLSKNILVAPGLVCRNTGTSENWDVGILGCWNTGMTLFYNWFMDRDAAEILGQGRVGAMSEKGHIFMSPLF